jgi:tetratricopeptide (TPR) repeat protein
LYDGISTFVRDYKVGYAALGIVLGRVGLWEEASQAFLKAAKKKPNSAGTWGNLGVAEHVLGNYKQSENTFQKALKLEPGYFDARPMQKKIAENSRKNRSVLQ